jgi:phosphoglycerate dehydrogenase-like enzyme
MLKILAIDVIERFPELVLFKDAEILVSSYEKACASDLQAEALAVSIYQIVDEALLKRLPTLRCIFVLGTSDKNIDTAYCQKNNIKIFAVRHYCDQETAEWIMLEVIKFFRERIERVSVCGRRLGIIGFGDVGAKVKDLALAFGLEVLVNTKSEQKSLNGVKFASKAEIFSTCDIISFNTPANTPWLTRDLFEAAKSGQGWINTCMGEISTDPHFADFLAQGRVRLVMDSIAGKSHQHLASLATICDQPAFDTKDSQQKLREKFLDNIKIYLLTR